MSVLGRSALTPCIGRCSHNVGDDICRGCKRTVVEVATWNTLSPDEKRKKMAELKERG